MTLAARRALVALFVLSALLGAQRHSAGTSHRTSHPSPPLEAQLGWRPVPVNGHVVIGFASLMHGQSVSGIVGGVPVGRLF